MAKYKYRLKYYKNYPTDLTILEKIEETDESPERIKGHLHVVSAELIVESNIIDDKSEVEIPVVPETEEVKVVEKPKKIIKRGRRKV